MVAGIVDRGDTDLAGRFVADVVNISASVAGPRGYRCPEEHPYRNAALATANRRQAGVFGAVADWFEMTEAMCEVWPLDEPAAAPPPASIPVLVVRGLMSPLTDESWRLPLQRAWQAARFLDLPTVTFGTGAVTPLCLDDVVRQWWTDPASVTQEGLDACAAASPPVAFVGAE